MADVQAPPRGIEGFGGLALYPGDDGYDEARRVFNGMIDRKPAIIARCLTTSRRGGGRGHGAGAKICPSRSTEESARA